MNLFLIRIFSFDLSFKETVGVVASIVGIIVGIYTIFSGSDKEKANHHVQITNNNDNSSTEVGRIGDDEYNLNIDKKENNMIHDRYSEIIGMSMDNLILGVNDTCILLNKYYYSNKDISGRLMGGLNHLTSGSFIYSMKERYPTANWDYVDTNQIELIDFVDKLQMITGQISVFDSSVTGSMNNAASNMMLTGLNSLHGTSLSREEMIRRLTEQKKKILDDNKILISNTCSIVTQSIEARR